MFWLQFKQVPKQALNHRLWTGVLVFGLMGAARGLDEGTISGTLTQPSFQHQFGLDDTSKSASDLANLKSNIASMVQVGCIAGALFGFSLLDILGRIRSLQLLLVVWIVGAILQITSFHGVGQLYAGRFIAGIGVGMTSVCCPTYLVEVSPAPIRGFCTCVYSGSVYLGIMIGYFSNWGTTIHITGEHNRNQWVIPTSLQLIFAGLGLIFSFCALESPRWLFKVNRNEDAIRALCLLRNMPQDSAYVDDEISNIYRQLACEQKGKPSKRVRLRSILLDCQYQICLCLFIQLLSQWTGSNAVTIYAPEFFSLVGISNRNSRMFATSMFGVVKFIASLVCALIIIDFFGRKRALYAGIFCQTISILYIGVFLAVTRVHGLSRENNHSLAHAGTGAIVMIYLNGIGWALGWNSIQYLINAEIFPIQLRSMATSMIMCFHFINQYSNSKSLPSMLLAMNDWGAMIFFAAVAAIGGLFAWFFIPEAAGLKLEEINMLFDRPWYQIGRAKLQILKE